MVGPYVDALTLWIITLSLLWDNAVNSNTVDKPGNRTKSFHEPYRITTSRFVTYAESKWKYLVTNENLKILSNIYKN